MGWFNVRPTSEDNIFREFGRRQLILANKKNNSEKLRINQMADYDNVQEKEEKKSSLGKTSSWSADDSPAASLHSSFFI